MFLSSPRQRRSVNLGGYRLVRFTTDPKKGREANPLNEFDEYGTELHKDARVWKVYVNETDKYDTELVNKWNDSTDVILIFAALFSAISTAFLVESSKLLQLDPADVSAQSLLFISRRLSTTVNGTQLPGPEFASASNPTEFIPSRTAVVVNTLWFLSLSLSLATSFIAILAKDWCHSFMSGRTGHPYSQTCKRQRKWDMIEKWKMSELLTLLPSLIHLALLLFSVGLCIYLADIYPVVAIPVLCVTAAAIGFYAWTSMAALKVDYFPYPTFISKIGQTAVVQHAFQKTLQATSQFASHPIIRIIRQLASGLVVGLLVSIQLLIIPPFIVSYLVKKLRHPLDACDRVLTRSSPIFQLFIIPLLQAVRIVVLYPAVGAAKVLGVLSVRLASYELSIVSQLRAAYWGLKWKTPDVQTNGHVSKQDEVTSLALSWLVTNCEAPQSVDIALQSIAGATSRTSCQPLLDCNAAFEISRRLASSNLYREPGARTDTKILLYSRGLEVLGKLANSNSHAARNETGTELEGLIWDLHLEVEKKVADWIADGKFKPTEPDLSALRIGATVASQSLKLLQKTTQSAEIDTKRLFRSVVELLELYLGGSQTLHKASLLSLINATTLLLPFAPDSPAAATLRLQCMRLIGYQYPDFTPHRDTTLIVGLVVACVSSFVKPTCQSQETQEDRRVRLEVVVRELIEIHAGGYWDLKIKIMLKIGIIIAHPEACYLGIGTVDSQTQDLMLGTAASSIHALYQSFWTRVQGGAKAKLQEDDMLSHLQKHFSSRSPVQHEPSSTDIYFFILVPMCRHWDSNQNANTIPRSSMHSVLARDNWQLASESRFPMLSRAFVLLVEKCEFVSELEKIIGGNNCGDKFIALGQLWLLFTLYLDPSSDAADDRERLGDQLRKYHSGDPKGEAEQHTQLGDQLVQMWESYSFSYYIWPTRLAECVLQSRNAPLSERHAHQLRDTPNYLRGLSSFTSWRPQPINIPVLNAQVTELGTSNTQQPEYAISVSSHHESDNRVPLTGVGRTLFASNGETEGMEADRGEGSGNNFGGTYETDDRQDKVDPGNTKANDRQRGENVRDEVNNRDDTFRDGRPRVDEGDQISILIHAPEEPISR